MLLFLKTLSNLPKLVELNNASCGESSTLEPDVTFMYTCISPAGHRSTSVGLIGINPPCFVVDHPGISRT